MEHCGLGTLYPAKHFRSSDGMRRTVPERRRARSGRGLGPSTEGNRRMERRKQCDCVQSRDELLLDCNLYRRARESASERYLWAVRLLPRFGCVRAVQRHHAELLYTPADACVGRYWFFWSSDL